MSTKALSTQRVALITGCSEPESIGANIARQLAKKGWRVFATARKVETMKGLEEEGCDLLEIDVTSDKSVKTAVEQLEFETGGRLDLLVNNAGVASLAPLLDMDVSRMRDLYDVNVFGGVRMLHACAEMLIRTSHSAAAGGKKATVVNIVSTARFMPPWQAAYGSSKAAFGAISDTMRVELAPLGVKVISVNLGGTKTAMLSGVKEFSLQRPVEDRTPYYTTYDTVTKPNLSAKITTNITATQVAQVLVAAAEKNSPPKIMWPGEGGWMFKYIVTRLPRSWTDALWAWFAGVNDVKKKVE
ncbi:hypothetical protein IAT38_000062 [Cryptococcus sp. DSM 104549]